jgi:hypothetical protein
MVSAVAKQSPIKKRARGAPIIESSANRVGRLGRPPVEDPIETSSAARLAHKPRLDLILRVQTTYRSVTGARRQTVNVDRQTEELDAHANELYFNRVRRSVGPLTTKTIARVLAAVSAAGGARKTATPTTAPAATNTGLPLVQRVQWMVVPELLSEELWKRHEYSLNDVRKTLDAFSPRVIWQMVRSYNYPATNASSRIFCETDTQFTYGSKSTAVQKLLSIIEQRFPDWSKRPSITWNMSKQDDPNGDGRFYEAYDRHTPGLPVHRVQTRPFEVLVAHLSSSSSSEAVAAIADLPSSWSTSTTAKTDMLTTATTDRFVVDAGSDAATQYHKMVRTVFAWRDILVVPLELNAAADMLLVGRVVPWRNYVQAYGLPRSLRSCPNIVRAPDGYYALMSEQFYFYCPDSLVSHKEASSTVLSSTHTPSTTPPLPTPIERPSKRAKTAKSR